MKFNQAVACFVGGVVCALVALMVTPSFAWLGLVAGFVGGYIAYEFRQFCQGVVIALRQSFGSVWDAGRRFLAWLSEPHPFVFTGLTSGLAIVCWIVVAGKEEVKLHDVPTLFGAGIIWAFIAMYFVCGFTDRGAKSEGSTWEKGVLSPDDWRKYNRYVPMTYTNFVRWTVKGVVFVFVDLFRAIPGGVGAIRRFTWILFLHVHSSERVSCGVYGSLGGITSYLVLVAPSMTLLQQGVLVFFGGLLGVGFGFIGQKVVATRILPASGNEAA